MHRRIADVIHCVCCACAMGDHLRAPQPHHTPFTPCRPLCYSTRSRMHLVNGCDVARLACLLKRLPAPRATQVRKRNPTATQCWNTLCTRTWTPWRQQHAPQCPSSAGPPCSAGTSRCFEGSAAGACSCSPLEYFSHNWSTYWGRWAWLLRQWASPQPAWTRNFHLQWAFVAHLAGGRQSQPQHHFRYQSGYLQSSVRAQKTHASRSWAAVQTLTSPCDLKAVFAQMKAAPSAVHSLLPKCVHALAET